MVPLLGPGQPLIELWMLSCDVKGQTFAWSAARLPEGSDFVTVEQAWRKATWIALGIALGEVADAPAGWQQLASVPPLIQRSQWQGPGMNHRGEPLQANLLWFQSGEWMHLAALYGNQVEGETLQTFFNSFSNREP